MAQHHHMKNRKPLSSPFNERDHNNNKLPLPRQLTLLILICYAAASLLKLPSSLFPISEQTTIAINTLNHLSSANSSHPEAAEQKIHGPPLPCSALVDHGGNDSAEPLLCCDRSHFRTDVCYMRGDIRTAAGTAMSRQKATDQTIILLHGATPDAKEEKIRPYTRKWEKEIMRTVDEITLKPVPAAEEGGGGCDVRHGVPGVVFSTGGYTGNVYHEFNDGLIPLYVTAERFGGEVVLLVLEYHSWWFSKYKSVLEKISRYKIVNLGKEKKVHCFYELIVGLKIHAELSIVPKLMPTRKGIVDFQSLLNRAFGDNQPASPAALLPATLHRRRPKLAILVRNRSRRLLNLRDVVRLSHRAGFDAELLNPKRSTPLADIQRSLSAADAMMAVHGAAVTHFLFMRPGSVLIQVVPLGLGWAAESFYGEPARRLGLQYLAYNVTPSESSLSREYSRNDPVLVNPQAVTGRGWAETKRVYLDKQDVTVNIRRFGKLLAEAHARLIQSRDHKT